MITRPSTSQLVAAVRDELRDQIAPKLDDPQATVTLQMIDDVLRGVELRCANELAWMREEIAAIEALAGGLVAATSATAVGDALQALRAGRAATDRYDDVQAEYDLASELLSRLIEATSGVEDEWRDRALATLRDRLAREEQIRGENFVMAGR